MTPTSQRPDGLSLAPFRALRFASGPDRLGDQLCPPYDVISAAQRAELVERSATNAVRLILPGQAEAAFGGGDRNLGSKALLEQWLGEATLALDPDPALYIYEMAAADGAVTRGLVGAIELRDPADGVILPHENTMAGPVSDRLALMRATEANLEPIYLVYDGGGAASAAVTAVTDQELVAQATTPDGTRHRLWAITDGAVLAAIADDLSNRRALIADGHHRYATYRQLQADHSGVAGAWDRGLTLLVDTSSYGPQVHPIHRVVQLGWETVLARSAERCRIGPIVDVADALAELSTTAGFALVLASDSEHAVLFSDLDPLLLPPPGRSAAERELASLDISILHQVVIERLWQLPDTEDTVGYAHDVTDALDAADRASATAVLLRATPIEAVARVAAAGGRMPRKSTLFTPKPASGMVLRRFADQ